MSPIPFPIFYCLHLETLSNHVFLLLISLIWSGNFYFPPTFIKAISARPNLSKYPLLFHIFTDNIITNNRKICKAQRIAQKSMWKTLRAINKCIYMSTFARRTKMRKLLFFAIYHRNRVDKKAKYFAARWFSEGKI